MTTQPPRISGTPAWAQQAPTSGPDPRQTAHDAPTQSYPTQAHPTQGRPYGPAGSSTYVPTAHPAATAQRVRERDAARGRVGGITAALAVAALVGTGVAVVAASDLGSSTSTTASSSDSSSGSSSSSSSSDTSSSSGTTVSSSNQSSVASTSGS